MSQKAKREGERSPPAGVSALPGAEQSPVVAPPSVGGVSSQEKPPVEKKMSGGSRVSPTELLDDQKLAGKKKGEFQWVVMGRSSNFW